MAEPLRTALRACLALAALTVLGGLVADQATASLAIALGVLLGSGNGLLAGRMLVAARRSGLGPPRAVTMSIARLVAVSLLAVSCGLVMGAVFIPLVVAGMVVAQVALAIVSAVQGVRWT